jgi:hypothetical protein
MIWVNPPHEVRGRDKIAIVPIAFLMRPNAGYDPDSSGRAAVGTTGDEVEKT